MHIQSDTIAAAGARAARHLVPAPEPDDPPAARRSYVLELDDVPEALERVLAQLRRRGCRVTDVAFAAPYVAGGPANLVVGTEAPHPRAHLVESWLAEVVSVVSVEPITV